MLQTRWDEIKDNPLDPLTVALILDAEKDDNKTEPGEDKREHQGITKQVIGEVTEIDEHAYGPEHNKDPPV
jgi:hypothetical protein